MGDICRPTVGLLSTNGGICIHTYIYIYIYIYIYLLISEKILRAVFEGSMLICNLAFITQILNSQLLGFKSRPGHLRKLAGTCVVFAG